MSPKKCARCGKELDHYESHVIDYRNKQNTYHGKILCPACDEELRRKITKHTDTYLSILKNAEDLAELERNIELYHKRHGR